MNGQSRNFLAVTVLFGLLMALVLFPGPTTDDEEMAKLNNSDTVSLENEKYMNSTVRAIFTDENKTLAELELERADTPREREQGLMNRRKLENGTGMLFVFEDSANRSFWMKNTYIPLDMIFVTAKKTVRTIKEADPAPNVSDEDLKIYTSEGPAKYVIETHQNFSEREGVKEGTEVSFQ